MDTSGPLHHADAIPEEHPSGPSLLPTRLGLIGAESSGKSTLAGALAAALPACIVPEELRAFVVREGRTPRQDEQAMLMAAQAEAEARIAATCPLPWIVADPAPLMTAVYSIAYFDDDSLVDAGLQQARGYRLVVWCDPGIPWQADQGQRDGPALRTATDSVIDGLVRGPIAGTSIDVLKVTGSVEQRVAAVLERLAWQPRPLGLPT